MIERIDRLEDRLNQVAERAEEIHPVSIKVDAMAHDVRMVLKILRGESDPERGLVSRVGSVERELDGIKRTSRKVNNIGWSAVKALIIAAAGAAGGASISRLIP